MGPIESLIHSKDVESKKIFNTGNTSLIRGRDIKFCNANKTSFDFSSFFAFAGIGFYTAAVCTTRTKWSIRFLLGGLSFTSFFFAPKLTEAFKKDKS